jgi:hypothetical protein
LEDRRLLATGAFLQGVTFVDSSNDGQLEASDPRLSGAEVRLYSADGKTLLGQVTTGADGVYRFDDTNVSNHTLTAGTYNLVETPPTHFANSAAQVLSSLNPSTVVSPSTIKVTILDPSQLTLTFNGAATFDMLRLNLGGTDYTDGAGQIGLTLNNPGLATPVALVGFCADINGLAGPGDTYAVFPIPTGIAFPKNGGQMAYLYNHYATRSLSTSDAAGLQLAIWKLEYDTTTDLLSGNLQYQGFAPPTTDDTALLAAAKFYLKDSAGKSESAVFLDETFGGTVVPAKGQGQLVGSSFNFANTAVVGASISGTKFLDIKGTGVRDSSDPRVAGVTIFLDTNNNGKLDPGEVSTTTDANGNYQFTDLAPGTYYVREVVPPRFVQTTPNPAAIIVTASGQLFGGVDFGNFKLISISGTKFQDTNDNGIRDPGEPGLAGVTIFLDTNNNGVLDAGEISTTTDANGNYHFDNLGPGVYHVREVEPTAWTQTTPNPAPIIALSGQNVTGIDFGNVQTTTTPAPVIAYNAMLPMFPLTGNFAIAPLLGSKVGLFGANVTDNMDGMIQQESNFVSGLYQTTLGRSPDTAGLTYWVQMLQDGFSRAAVAAQIWESPEHRALEVTQFYTTILHRAPDKGGLAFWTNTLLGGAGEEHVMLGLLASAEYKSSHASDTAFVDGLYADVLGRKCDTPGEAFWLAALAGGVSRVTVVEGFLTSQAAETRVLDSFYAKFLGRAGDRAGELFWVNQLQSGHASFASVAESFVASDEFFSRTSAMH